jgi:hypothetical protein
MSPRPSVVVFTSQGGVEVERQILKARGVDVVYADKGLRLDDLERAFAIICPSVYELSR